MINVFSSRIFIFLSSVCDKSNNNMYEANTSTTYGKCTRCAALTQHVSKET